MNGFKEIVGGAGYAIEVVGVIVIIFGSMLATGRALARLMRNEKTDLFGDYRREIGRSMLLGLEFLVAGDIIRTVIVSHSVSDVAGLGLLVVIRTVLVFTIHLEVEGRWPWQHDSPGGTNG